MTTTTIKLTEDQEKAIALMKEFCAYPEHKFFRLTGYAGTGKSFTICQLIQWLQDNNYKVIACSPTNKAAKNLENMASEAGIDLEVTTVAKLLGQQAVLNEQTGKEEFISQGTETIDTYDVIIIDEFSMVNIDNFVDIKIEEENSNGTKVIFVGDSAQLPPVNENEPIVATHPEITCHANLSTVVRYDGELAKVAEKVRRDRSYSQTTDGVTTYLDVRQGRLLGLAIALSDLSKILMYKTSKADFFVMRSLYMGSIFSAAARLKSLPCLPYKLLVTPSGQTIYPFITTSDRTIVCLDRYEWLQTAVSLFKSDEFKVNPNYVRFLVWRNKHVIHFGVKIVPLMYLEIG